MSQTGSSFMRMKAAISPVSILETDFMPNAWSTLRAAQVSCPFVCVRTEPRHMCTSEIIIPLAYSAGPDGELHKKMTKSSTQLASCSSQAVSHPSKVLASWLCS